MTSDYAARVGHLSATQRQQLLDNLQRAHEAPPIYRASKSQEAVWSACQIEPDNVGYHIAGCTEIRGELDPVALEKALGFVAERHAPLRSTFALSDQGDFLEVRVTGGLPRLARVDISALPDTAREPEAWRLATEFARRPFNLTRGPLCRALLVELGATSHLFGLVLHHIVADGRSIAVLLQELMGSYERLRRGERPIATPLRRNYAEYAQAQRTFEESARGRTSLEYWHRQLAEMPPTSGLLVDRPRPASRSPRGGRVHFSFPAELAEEFFRCCVRLNSTPFVGAYAGFVAALHQLTGERDIAVGTPLLGRCDAEQDLIGLFVNIVVLRLHIGSEDSFETLLKHSAQVVAEAHDHGDLPFSVMLESLDVPRLPGTMPLFQVSFSMNNAPRGHLQHDGLDIEPVALDLGAAVDDLAISVVPGPHSLSGFADYREDVLDRATVETLLRAWQETAAAAAEKPSAPLSGRHAMKMHAANPSEPRDAESATARRSLQDWFWRPCWQPTPMPATPIGETRGDTLLFGGNDDITNTLALELAARGQRVIVVAKGTSFFADDRLATVCTGDLTHAARLIAHLVQSGFTPSRLVHLWPLTSAGASDTATPEFASRLETAQKEYLWVADFLSQSARIAPHTLASLTFAVPAVHKLSPDDKTDPTGALLLGLASALPHEAAVTCKLVDLDSQLCAAPAACAATLLAELGCNDAASVIAYRGGIRWQRTLQPFQQPYLATADQVLREHGTYVITGGLGGIGLELAEFIASVCRANLVLLSRGAASPNAEIRRRLLRLQESGVRVTTLVADVGDRAGLAAALREARALVGPINGVFHAAGVVQYRTLSRRTTEDSESVLRPKLAGTVNLHSLLQDESALDFVALFSSIAAYDGGVGALDYCAANNFLDCFAQSQTGARPHWISLAWGMWRDVGAAAAWAPHSASAEYRERLAGGISVDDGMQVMLRALASDCSTLVVSPQAPLADAESRVSQPELAPPVMESASVGEEVAAIWKAVLGVQKVHPDDDFFSIGGHSLLLVSLINRLNRKFGRLLPLGRILEEPTLATCIRLLESREHGAPVD